MKKMTMAMTAMLMVLVFGCTSIKTPRASIFTCRDPNRVIGSLETAPSLTKPIVLQANAYGAMVTAGDGNPDTLAAIHDVALPATASDVVESSLMAKQAMAAKDTSPRRGRICNQLNRSCVVKAMTDRNVVVGEVTVEAKSSAAMELPPGFYILRAFDENGQMICQIGRMVPFERDTRAVFDPARNCRVRTSWAAEIVDG